MMERKEIIKNVLIVFCVIILFFICALVIREINPELYGATRELQRIAFFIIVTSMILNLLYQIYRKPLTQEMKEEEIKEADQEEIRQSLFKPTIGVLIFFLLFTVGPLLIAIDQFIKNKVDPGFILPALMTIAVITFMWYIVPVFIFTEDSVQIKSFLFYFFRINRKTVIKYADITSVRPDPKFEGNDFGMDRRFRIEISAGGTTKVWPVPLYNSDRVAKIYLRFREKLGDKVKLK